MKMLVAFLSLRVWEGAFFGCFYFATFLAQALIHLPYFCLTGSDAQDHTPSQTFGCLREVALGGGREEFSPSPPVNRTHLRLLSNGTEWGRVLESCVGRKDFLLFFVSSACPGGRDINRRKEEKTPCHRSPTRFDARS